jgi:hypothetical protein
MKNTEKLKTNNGLIRERRISKKHQKLMFRAVFVLFVGVSRRKHLSPSFREYDLANCRFIVIRKWGTFFFFLLTGTRDLKDLVRG